MKDITILIFTHNEEKNIRKCLASARILTKNIIVIDSQSTDKTVRILKEEKVKFYSFPYQRYVEPAREFGIKKASTSWVLILDADERITQPLSSEIKEKIKDEKFSFYFIPRKNIFINHWLKHGGWWPDFQIRLINKKYFLSWPKQIHSTPKIKGEGGYLNNPLLHFFHGDLEAMVEKTAIFEEIEADLLYNASKKANVFIFFRKFFGEFWRRFFKSFGFLDGNIGIIEAIYQAFSKTVTYLFLYEKYLFNKKIGLYNPYLNVLGGGEKHILSIVKVFEDLGFVPYIFWDKDLKKEIKNRLGINFKNLFFLPNIFKKKSFFSFFKVFLTLKKFDYFFYVTDGSYFFSLAKKNFVFAMVPDKSLYQLNFINRLKLSNWCFITNSSFTSYWLKKWGINSYEITPYIDENFFKLKSQKKEKIILCVGRFFSHLHSKRQDIAIKTFKEIKQKNPFFKSFKLILVGGLKAEDKGYFNNLKKIADNDQSIIFKINVSQKELYHLYQKAYFFWHFAGFEINEEKTPQNVEHLGIAPLEAMASFCLTFCYNAGGPKFLVKDGKTGFLFNSKEELMKKMERIITDKEKQEEIKKNAYHFVLTNFSYKVFKEKVKKLISKT